MLTVVSTDFSGDREHGHPQTDGIRDGHLELQVFVWSLGDELYLPIPQIFVE